MDKSVLEFPSELLKSLRQARRVVILTGAGVSAESGVPTFRDAQTGLWAQFRPEELATAAAFRSHPRRVWEWYAWRRELVARAEPNSGHLALVELEQCVPEFTLMTQNVDGLHQRAGSRRVIELHGNVHCVKCFDENVVVESWTETDDVPPRCPRCGGWLRPDVVWFGEPLPFDALRAAEKATRSGDVFFAIGTSGLVEPAASLPLISLWNGATVVEINPNPTPLTPQATFALQGASGRVLPELMREFR
jgi:NAD-dependent deacetylase